MTGYSGGMAVDALSDMKDAFADVPLKRGFDLSTPWGTAQYDILRVSIDSISWRGQDQAMVSGQPIREASSGTA